MKIFRWIAVAFSLYSRIPMPHFKWEEEDMSKSLLFFPWVGAVIGAVSGLIWFGASYYHVPILVGVLLMGLVPLIITGGFHVDGYMDVEDARRSYQPKEKKLEILSDPHIGAFSVISLAICLMLYGVGIGLLFERFRLEYAVIYGCIFYISRCASGICALTFKKAKDSGMLFEETRKKNRLSIILFVTRIFMALAVMTICNIWMGTAILAVLIIGMLLYGYTSYRTFGGVTGDTAGHFLVTVQCAMILVLGVLVFVL